MALLTPFSRRISAQRSAAIPLPTAPRSTFAPFSSLAWLPSEMMRLSADTVARAASISACEGMRCDSVLMPQRSLTAAIVGSNTPGTDKDFTLDNNSQVSGESWVSAPSAAFRRAISVFSRVREIRFSSANTDCSALVMAVSACLP